MTHPKHSPKHVLVICTGNKHRSPVTAALFRKLGVTACSAGVSNHIDGHRFPPRTRAIVDKLPGPELYSKRVTQAYIKWADYILYMQPSHQKFLVETFSGCWAKLYDLAGYAEPPLKRIPDPGFDMKIFDEVVAKLDQCVHNFIRRELKGRSNVVRA